MKRILKFFLIVWSVIFVISFFTAKWELPLFQRLGFTAGMAGFATLIAIVGEKGKPPRKIRVIDILEPNSPKILYQVKDGKIYPHLNPKPIYEIKENNICLPNSSKVVYILKGKSIHRNTEPTPIWEIRGNQICIPLSNKVVYDTKVRYEHPRT